MLLILIWVNLLSETLDEVLTMCVESSSGASSLSRQTPLTMANRLSKQLGTTVHDPGLEST